MMPWVNAIVNAIGSLGALYFILTVTTEITNLGTSNIYERSETWVVSSVGKGVDL